MKKMRKIFAVLLTLAMVFGMSMTSFAATKDTATITVNNADKATLTYAQVIKADQSTETGWAFVNTEVANAYKTAFKATDDEMMGIVEIPKIDIKLPIYHTTEEDVLKQAAGHLEGSSLPIGGKSTHSVISAHRGLPSASLFTDLDQLKKGDHFLIHVLNKTLCYEVDKISVVKPEETSALAVEEGEDLVTLLTCTPYGVNTERILVRGHRVPYEEQKVADEKTPLSGISLHTNYLLWVIIGLVITTIFILMLYLKEKKLQKKKNETS